MCCRLKLLARLFTVWCLATTSLFSSRTTVAATTSLAGAVADMMSLASPAPSGSSLCRRLVTLGGICTCSFSDGVEVNEETVRWDRHVYGRRRVCLDHLLPPDRCAALVISNMPFNSNFARFNQSLRRLGCEKPLQVAQPNDWIRIANSFDNKRLPSHGENDINTNMGTDHSLDLLDIMVMWKLEPILGEVAGGRVTAKQVTYTALFDVAQMLDDAQSGFKASTLEMHISMARKLQSAGYRVLSAIHAPRCVSQLSQKLSICLPISIDLTWIKSSFNIL